MLHTGAYHLPVYLRSLLVGHVEAQRLFTFLYLSKAESHQHAILIIFGPELDCLLVKIVSRACSADIPYTMESLV